MEAPAQSHRIRITLSSRDVKALEKGEWIPLSRRASLPFFFGLAALCLAHARGATTTALRLSYPSLPVFPRVAGFYLDAN